MTDPIADLLTRIKNGYMARKATIVVPHSKTKHAIADILKTAGYLDNVELSQDKPFSNLKLTLSYFKGLSLITGIRRLSKPGRRLYIKSHNISRALPGQGISIISTPKGIMTDAKAKKSQLGGELICKVW